MSAYDQLKEELKRKPRTWLVTGAAGFIGSNLLEHLLRLDQRVAGLDNFATGKQTNLEAVRAMVTPDQWGRFRFVSGDIRQSKACQEACRGVDFVLHQAALGSVPRSLEDPVASHESNVTGFLHMILAARDQKVKRFVYASSSAVYGDEPDLPKTESKIGRALSPYAATKHMNELYAGVVSRCYGVESIGLRYFNVFGPRQDPEGPYAAVIPKWIQAMLAGKRPAIYGDGETSRDFCYVENVVQANLLAAATTRPEAINEVYNVALNDRLSLNDLYRSLKLNLERLQPGLEVGPARYEDFRPGDVRHSQADISKARDRLGYEPTHTVDQGLEAAMAWYVENLEREDS